MMVHAKNYETVSTFVKVMQKKTWPLFFRTRCTVCQHDINDMHHETSYMEQSGYFNKNTNK